MSSIFLPSVIITTSRFEQREISCTKHMYCDYKNCPIMSQYKYYNNCLHVSMHVCMPACIHPMILIGYYDRVNDTNMIRVSVSSLALRISLLGEEEGEEFLIVLCSLVSPVTILIKCMSCVHNA